MDSNGVPFGLQLMGPRWADERLLAIAEAMAAVTGGLQRATRLLTGQLKRKEGLYRRSLGDGERRG